jgi:thioredoxin 1
MLDTNLKHITTDEEYQKVISENENVMICCGRMGPMCLPVYDIMESIESEYSHVTFRDMDFDEPVGVNIRSLPEVQGFMGLPFTVYYKNGKVVEATTSIQSKTQVLDILDSHFGAK